MKQFSADELVALARGFDLPLGWLFLPPPPEEDAGLAVKGDDFFRGGDMPVLLDVVLGTPSSTAPWREAILAYAAATAAAEAERRGTGAAGSDTVEHRLEGLAELRAANELRQAFGNVAEARDVLLRLAGLLDRLDGLDPSETHEPAPTGTRTKGTRRSRS